MPDSLATTSIAPGPASCGAAASLASGMKGLPPPVAPAEPPTPCAPPGPFEPPLLDDVTPCPAPMFPAAPPDPDPTIVPAPPAPASPPCLTPAWSTTPLQAGGD